MTDPFRASLGLVCGVLALLLGGIALIEMGAGLMTGPVEGPSEFVVGMVSLPVASVAGWGAWRFFR